MVLGSYPDPAAIASKYSDLVPSRKCLPGRSLLNIWMSVLGVTGHQRQLVIEGEVIECFEKSLTLHDVPTDFVFLPISTFACGLISTFYISK